MSIKVQIYLRTAEDAAMTAAAGADFIGLVCDKQGLGPVSLDVQQARRVFGAVPEGIAKVALTASPEVQTILHLIEALDPDVLHLAGDLGLMPPHKVAELRSAIPTVKIMRAIPIHDQRSIEAAIRYQTVSDYLILDTHDPHAVDIGATGRVHDWTISAELVRRVRVPVFLAGGLSPDNVAEAIRTVRPWGVDSFSLTNMPGHPDRKDPASVRAFVTQAKAALPQAT
jgi:phosphoribosylanthranilate isomerase